MHQTAVDFFTTSKDAWDAMLYDIERATKTVDIEQYIFTIDSIGSKFIKILQEKAKEGVRVRLLCDAVGSFAFYRSAIPELLQSIGIEVRFFNPISPSRIANFTSNFFRDHRKIMVVDGEVGHIGGVGIQEHMADWRDTHMRVRGPLVQDLADSFEAVWVDIKKWKFIRFPKQQRFVKNFNLLTNSPGFGQRLLYHQFINEIRNAKHSIYLTTPYFIPDVILFRVLRLAAKRGVDVRIVVPTIADHIFVNHAREAYFSLALHAGIRIYTYNPNNMMHAKAAIIDDAWGTAGSFNLDNLSFYFNHEANIATTDKKFISELHQHFFTDISNSKEIKKDEWDKRPFRKKFLEFLTWPFHGVL